MKSHSVYLHIPFCQHRCGYCDFNTYAGIENLIPAYVDALQTEISYLSENNPSSSMVNVKTIYFGGGTPSLLPPGLIEKILNTIDKSFSVEAECEITLEVNPGTISKNDLNTFYEMGVNRLSIGVQSTNQEELNLLERLHGFSEACYIVENARTAGFENISLDLIFGLPEQKPLIWKKSLYDALSLSPEHLSLYALTVEEGTPLEKQILKGEISVPDPDLTADLYDITRQILKTEGYIHYEISNWVKYKPGISLPISRHNTQYWMNEPYIGFGAGAHGYLAGLRTENIANPFKYVKSLKDQSIKSDYPSTPATIETTIIHQRREMEDTMIMGLRLLQEGVSIDRFINRFGQDFREVFASEISHNIDNGMLKWGGINNRNLVLSEKAYFLANKVFVDFLES